MSTSTTTPHRTVTTPTNRATFTPCTRMNNMTLNSISGTNRIKMINPHQQASNFDKRMLEIAGEEDDTPEHPNLTMVLGSQKISFDQLLNDDHAKPSFMLLSDDDDSDEEINENSNTFSPCRMSLSPDRGFPTQMMEFDDNNNRISGSPSLFNKKLPRNDPHYDPDFSFADGVFEDGENEQNNNKTTIDLLLTDSTDTDENSAPSLWLKHFNTSSINLKKTPVGNAKNNNNSNSLPLQEITVNCNIPSTFDNDERPLRHTQKKKVVGDRPQRMRMMRSLSPTHEDMRKGKEPSTKPLDASAAFFL